ncbi:MAG TPA: fimbria/pilus periplasmic chaperone [Buttiauxella sp.]|jgi:chaperone protein EcpD
MIIKTSLSAVVLLAFALPSSAMANIVINGTRVIYNGGEKEATVKLTDVGKSPMLVQSWIDTGDANAKPETIQVPFILTPPVNRIEPGKSQTLRLAYTHMPELPEDRESCLWLNVLEVPPTPADGKVKNYLQMAFRTRIKLFYRPAILGGSENEIEASKNVKWSVAGNKLHAVNASAFYVSLSSVTVELNGHKVKLDADMVDPKGARDFSFKSSDAGVMKSGAKLAYQYVNDWGAIQTVNTTL